MDVYLIRHTTPQVEKGTYYGQCDIALAHTYEQDIYEVRAKLPERLGAVYSSPLTRCVTLARELPTNYFRTDERLMEMSLGDWEMKRWDEIDAKALEHWTNHFDTTAPPNGESFEQLYARVVPFFESLIASDYASVGVVTHGGVIRSILNYLLQIPLKKSFAYELDYGSVTLIDLHSTWAKVKYVNR
jgi:alpha-ribazole phosphatase